MLIKQSKIFDKNNLYSTTFFVSNKKWKFIKIFKVLRYALFFSHETSRTLINKYRMFPTFNSVKDYGKDPQKLI